MPHESSECFKTSTSLAAVGRSAGLYVNMDLMTGTKFLQEQNELDEDDDALLTAFQSQKDQRSDFAIAPSGLPKTAIISEIKDSGSRAA